MKGFARYRTMAGAGVAAALIAGLSMSPTFATSSTASAMSSDVVAEWSSEVWRTALHGDPGDALELLEHIPEASGSSTEVTSLRTSLAQYRTNLLKRGEARTERLAELDAELKEHVEADELLEALRSANEMYQLAFDKEALLKDARISDLVRESERRARAFEEKGQWLDAHAYYNLLHLLYYDQMTYKDDLTRVLQRLQMLGMYLPENLHDLRSDQRVALGEDPLPPYNATADDWHAKLEPITFDMVLRAISYADQAQVDDIGLAPMLRGGFRAVRNMVTMKDLAEAFPSLADQASVRPFLVYVDEQLTYI
ncbi:MAG: hypothetical protein KDA21_12935, partial [Phycisphaerales bacterium]|nr:hypothetical protein [Phycisphaerales bacterium]